MANERVEPRMLTLKEVMKLTGMGETSARSFCKRIGARRQFSERVIRYDRKVIEAEFEAMAQGDTE